VLCYWDGKASRIEAVIDANDRVTAVRRVGPGSGAATVSRPDGTRAVALTRGQAQVAVGTGANARIQLTWDATRQRWDGLSGLVLTEAAPQGPRGR
jgi:hypothetical protein